MASWVASPLQRLFVPLLHKLHALRVTPGLETRRAMSVSTITLGQARLARVGLEIPSQLRSHKAQRARIAFVCNAQQREHADVAGGPICLRSCMRFTSEVYFHVLGLAASPFRGWSSCRVPRWCRIGVFVPSFPFGGTFCGRCHWRPGIG